jgi:hypothetical protein
MQGRIIGLVWQERYALSGAWLTAELDRYRKTPRLQQVSR